MVESASSSYFSILCLLAESDSFDSLLAQWKGVAYIARLFTISDPRKKVPLAVDMLFPKAWLDEIAEGDPENQTNRQLQEQV